MISQSPINVFDQVKLYILVLCSATVILIDISTPLCSILKIRTSVPKQRGKDNSERQVGCAVSQDMIMTSIETKPNTAYETVIRQQDQEILEPLYEIPEP